MFWPRSFVGVLKRIFSNTTRAPSIADLAEHIERLAAEQTFINHYFAIREQFNIIVRQSPVANVQNEFWQFTHLAYAHEIIIRLSRLFDRQFADSDKKIQSLHVLLLEVRRSHELLSRNHYVGASTQEEWITKNPQRKFPNGEPDVYEYQRFNREYDETVGSGLAFLPKSAVDKDLKLLRATMRNLNLYRNKTLAHNSVEQKSIPVKFSEITDAVDVMNKLIYKYYLLIKRGTHTLNFSDPDITRLFMQPWIADKKARDAIEAEFDNWLREQREKV